VRFSKFHRRHNSAAGDFAVLLKAGMSAKQAVFYNLLSSVLCLFGMVLGVFLGESETATASVFAAAAGMFLYIALVDMVRTIGCYWLCNVRLFSC
jgi:zinc transporter ZupT